MLNLFGLGKLWSIVILVGLVSGFLGTLSTCIYKAGYHSAELAQMKANKKAQDKAIVARTEVGKKDDAAAIASQGKVEAIHQNADTIQGQAARAPTVGSVRSKPDAKCPDAKPIVVPYLNDVFGMCWNAALDGTTDGPASCEAGALSDAVQGEPVPPAGEVQPSH